MDKVRIVGLILWLNSIGYLIIHEEIFSSLTCSFSCFSLDSIDDILKHVEVNELWMQYLLLAGEGVMIVFIWSILVSSLVFLVYFDFFRWFVWIQWSTFLGFNAGNGVKVFCDFWVLFYKYVDREHWAL